MWCDKNDLVRHHLTGVIAEVEETTEHGGILVRLDGTWAVWSPAYVEMLEPNPYDTGDPPKVYKASEVKVTIYGVQCSQYAEAEIDEFTVYARFP